MISCASLSWTHDSLTAHERVSARPCTSVFYLQSSTYLYVSISNCLICQKKLKFFFMKTHRIENKKTWIEMLNFVDAFLPRNTWPKSMRRKIFGGSTITYTARLKCCLFLFGNGIPPKFIRIMLQPLPISIFLSCNSFECNRG